MKILFITSACLLALTQVNAQTSAGLNGKKIKASSVVKSNSSISAPQGDMDIPTTSTFTYQEDVKNANGSAITITSTFKRLQVAGNMMGKDISIDTDNKNAEETKVIIQAMKQFDLPEDLSINTASLKGVVFDPKLVSSAEIVNKLFLPNANSTQFKEGFSWKENIKDSLGSNEDITYTVTKASTTDIEISTLATVKSIANIQQNGMDLKQTNQGTVKGTRVYDATTSVLRSETQNFDLTGVIEMMGMEMKTKNTGSVITSIE